MQLTPAEVEAVRRNLFQPDAELLEDKRFPWHRNRDGEVTAAVPQSSQAIAISVFRAIRGLQSRDAVATRIADALGCEARGPWEIQLERLVPKDLLGEPRRTQVDVSLEAPDALIFLECKFTEPDGGSCSQVGPLREGSHHGQAQCSGSYVEQRNPVNGLVNRCALTAKGVAYWDFTEETLGFSKDRVHDPCPFKGGWFQWMRKRGGLQGAGRRASPCRRPDLS